VTCEALRAPKTEERSATLERGTPPAENPELRHNTHKENQCLTPNG
jgi:hypothetical protein